MNNSDKQINIIAQAVHVYNDRTHAGTARAKTRAEVARTTKKVYKQKHTGNARHGSKKAPIFIGGGVTHGPKGVKRILVLPKQMRKSALATALAMKKHEKLLSSADFSGVTKTKEALSLLPQGKKHTVVIKNENKNAFRAFRNAANVAVFYHRDLNARAVFLGGHVVLDEQKEKSEKAKKTTKK